MAFNDYTHVLNPRFISVNNINGFKFLKSPDITDLKPPEMLRATLLLESSLAWLTPA